MTELAFPLLGTLVVFLLAVPAVTLAAKVVLVRRRKTASHLPRFGTNAMWLLVVAPVIAPIVWFTSAALHQSEPGNAIAACLHEHLGGEACHDALVFALGLSLLVLYVGAQRVRRELTRRSLAPRRLTELDEHTSRVARVCSAHDGLRHLRVSVLSESPIPICTLGLLRPRIEVTATFLDALDNDALTGALLHEAAHVRAFDPLRFSLLSICQSLNPAGFLLRIESQRWLLAREAACDEEAVLTGGDPLSLAHAIVTAARCTSGPSPAYVAALGERGVDNIQIRVGLLLHQAEGGETSTRPEAPFFGLTALLALVAAMPHLLGSGPLDTLHISIETALLVLGIY